MRRVLLIGLSFGLLIGTCLSYLLLTQSGLRFLSAAFLPDSIHLGAVYGRLLGPVRVEDLSVQQAGVTVNAEQITIDWSLVRALRGNVVIEIISVDAVEIVPEGAESRQIDIAAAAGVVTVSAPYSIDLAFDWELEPRAGVTARGTGRVAGNLDSLEATLSASLPFEWQAAGTITDLIDATNWEATIEIPEFGIEGTPIEVELGGNVTWAPDVTYAIVGQWRSIAWTFTGLAETQSPEGRFDIAGSLSSYQGSLSGRLRVPDNLALDPEASIDATFSGDTSNVQFNDIEIGTGGGGINGTASVDWSNGPRFDTQLRAEQFDPGLFFAGIAGEIDFGLIIEAAGSGGTPDYRLQLEPLSGVVNDYAVSGRASLQPDADGNALAEMDLRSGESTLSGSGLIGPMLDIAWQIDARDLSAFATQLSGALRSQGRVSGNRGAPRVEVTATGADIGLGELRVGALDTQIDFDAGTGIIRESHTEVSDLRWRELTFERVVAAAEGSAERHIINADLATSDGVTEIRAAGGYGNRRWSGELSSMETNLFGGWALEAPTALEFADGELAPAEVCLLGNPGRFCASGSWIKGSAWDVESDLEGADLTSFELFLPPAYEFSGSVSAAFRGRSGANEAWQGMATIDVGDVAVTTRGTGVELLTDGSGTAALDLDNRALALDFELNSQQGELEARVNAGLTGPDAALAGELRGTVSDLELLTLPFPELLDVTGELAINVSVEGSVGAPLYSGEIALLNGAAGVAAAGITLEDIGLELSGSVDEIVVGGEARSGEGTVRLDGGLRWSEGTPSGRFSLAGQRFRFVDVPGVRVDASPNLDLVIAGRELELAGNVHVDHIDVAPVDLRQTVRVSTDEIVIGETPPEPERWRVSSRVSVSLGEDVAIDAYGLEGRLRGSLSVVDLPGSPAAGSGELAVEDGFFSAYGQSLDIERGRLLFNGGPLNNPTLDIRAFRQYETITAGVDVRGPLQNPEITVFTDPPRPRQYALATLIMGAAPVELGRASDTLAYGGASGPGDGTVGLGDLSAGGASSASSFLAPDFYMGYLESISLRYRLTRRWTIGVGRGDSTSVDVSYSVR